MSAVTVTHDPDALHLLRAKAGPQHNVRGSDHPFDVADSDPLDNAVRAGSAGVELEETTRRFPLICLGAPTRTHRTGGRSRGWHVRDEVQDEP